jgi:hypothetical protein
MTPSLSLPTGYSARTKEDHQTISISTSGSTFLSLFLHDPVIPY